MRTSAGWPTGRAWPPPGCRCRAETRGGRRPAGGSAPHPQQVGRAVVPAPGEAVAPGHRLLVAEQEGLVGGVEVDLVDDRGGGQVDPDGGHEPQRPVDAVGDGVVAPPGRAAGHELLVPAVDLVEVGEPALGEGAQQVEGGRRLVVGAQHPGRVGLPSGRAEAELVDHVPAVDGQVDPVDQLAGQAAGLGELAGDATDLDHREPGPVGQDHRHLQDDLELVADRVGREGVEGLGAVPAWSRKPCPEATVARVDCRVLASPAKTSGGWEASSLRTWSSGAGSGHSGCCAAGNARQESGAQGWVGVRTVGFIAISSQNNPARACHRERRRARAGDRPSAGPSAPRDLVP